MLENVFHTNLLEALSGIVGVLTDCLPSNMEKLFPLPYAKYSVMRNSSYLHTFPRSWETASKLWLYSKC